MKNTLKTFICDIVYSPFGNKVVSLVGGQKMYAELHVRSEKKKILAEAKKEFDKKSALGNFDDYKQALEKHWVTYAEYANQYEFYKKPEKEREEYISRLRMAYFYWRYAPGTAKLVFRNKTRFLKAFNKYIHKPCDGKLGKGIFKTHKDDVYKGDELYEICVKDRMLVEQCVEECEELKAFHPQSLNTLRVVTIANKEKACVFSGVFRTGVGESVVDNSHKGGVSAQVNVKDGVIETDGANTSGERFVSHPDSGIVFKGYKIPKWDKIVDTCCEAAKLTENPITGWDVVLNNQGEVEFIEANYGPDMDMLQTRYKTGAKRKIYALIKEYCDIDLE